jgi:hypothetical protein
MASVMSPNSPLNELAGMQLAENLLSARCRQFMNRRQVISFGEEAYKRFCAKGLVEKGDGFRRMCYIIAQERGA